MADPTVAPALEQVAEQGWCDEAQEFARGALAALSDREAFADVDEDHLHLMLSCECLRLRASSQTSHVQKSLLARPALTTTTLSVAWLAGRPMGRSRHYPPDRG